MADFEPLIVGALLELDLGDVGGCEIDVGLAGGGEAADVAVDDCDGVGVSGAIDGEETGGLVGAGGDE